MTGPRKKAPAKKTGTKIANWEDRLAERAAKVDATEQGQGGNFISTKGGDFSYKSDVLPQPLPVVIVDYAFVNTYYDGVFDENNPRPPACFAIARADVGVEDILAPHPDAPDPQSEFCKDCDMNAWGTDMKGVGKACKNQRRLALLPADDLESVDEGTELAYMSVPPGSLKFFSGYVKRISKVLKRPPEGVITDLSTEPLSGGHSIQFNLNDDMPSVPDDKMGIIFELQDLCQEELLSPPDFSEREAKKPARRAPAKRVPAKQAPRRTVKKKAAKKKY